MHTVTHSMHVTTSELRWENTYVSCTCPKTGIRLLTHTGGLLQDPVALDCAHESLATSHTRLHGGGIPLAPLGIPISATHLIIPAPRGKRVRDLYGSARLRLPPHPGHLVAHVLGHSISHNALHLTGRGGRSSSASGTAPPRGSRPQSGIQVWGRARCRSGCARGCLCFALA